MKHSSSRIICHSREKQKYWDISSSHSLDINDPGSSFEVSVQFLGSFWSQNCVFCMGYPQPSSSSCHAREFQLLVCQLQLGPCVQLLWPQLWPGCQLSLSLATSPVTANYSLVHGQLSVKHCQISGQRVSSEPFKQTLPPQNWFLRQFSVILTSCRGSEPWLYR